MQIVVHVNGFNEWVPVPKSVARDAAFEKAILNGKVKPSVNEEFTMKVHKPIETHTVVHVGEADVIQCMLQEMTRGDRVYLTRVQAVTRLLARHILPHWCRPTDVQEFQISQDDGPDVVLFHKVLDEHVACGNLTTEDLAEMLATYTEPADADDHHDHLHAHFRVKDEKLATFREARELRESTHRQITDHFHAMRAKALEVITPVEEKVST